MFDSDHKYLVRALKALNTIDHLEISVPYQIEQPRIEIRTSDLDEAILRSIRGISTDRANIESLQACNIHTYSGSITERYSNKQREVSLDDITEINLYDQKGGVKD